MRPSRRLDHSSLVAPCKHTSHLDAQPPHYAPVQRERGGSHMPLSSAVAIGARGVSEIHISPCVPLPSAPYGYAPQTFAREPLAVSFPCLSMHPQTWRMVIVVCFVSSKIDYTRCLPLPRLRSLTSLHGVRHRPLDSRLSRLRAASPKPSNLSNCRRDTRPHLATR